MLRFIVIIYSVLIFVSGSLGMSVCGSVENVTTNNALFYTYVYIFVRVHLLLFGW